MHLTPGSFRQPELNLLLTLLLCSQMMHQHMSFHFRSLMISLSLPFSWNYLSRRPRPFILHLSPSVCVSPFPWTFPPFSLTLLQRCYYPGTEEPCLELCPSASVPERGRLSLKHSYGGLSLISALLDTENSQETRSMGSERLWLEPNLGKFRLWEHVLNLSFRGRTYKFLCNNLSGCWGQINQQRRMRSFLFF